MVRLIGVLLRYLPTPEWFMNNVVNRLPFRMWRHRLYQALGVTFEDPRSGCIMLGAEIHAPHRLTIGRNSVIGPRAMLDARGGITIGRDVNITGGVRFMTAKHDVQDPDFTAVYSPIDVGDRAWVTLGVTVLGGVTLGEGAVAAANATVTKDVPAFTIVSGTPAQAVGKRNPDLRYTLDYRPNWI
jgi:acetyltransferase-like isoleucine patch superfamily enzyme